MVEGLTSERQDHRDDYAHEGEGEDTKEEDQPGGEGRRIAAALLISGRRPVSVVRTVVVTGESATVVTVMTAERSPAVAATAVATATVPASTVV
jgi:hypothetical protein